MPRYKRTADAAQLEDALEPAIAPEAQEMLTTLRNMWEFASLMQYIFLFGNVVKIDEDFDIEDLEHDCLQPTPSERLARIGLQLLKYVSSHRGLTLEIFDEYTRRQYLAKAPQRNPFGDDEEPTRFNDLDIYTRVKVLQQLSVWTLGNAERIRGMMPQEEDHLSWRIDPLGWDKEDRSYYVLDDNRLYRRTDELPPRPTPQPKPKAKSGSKSKSKTPARGTRTSKRRKVEESEDEDEQQPEAERTAIEDTLMTDVGDETAPEDADSTGYGFTRKTWELIAVTLEEYQEFMASIFRSRDPNEKQLRARIEEDVMPIIEKRAEALQAKRMKKIRELENLQKMATAKRSSRLANKADKEAEARKEREAQEQRKNGLQLAREEQERQQRIEEGHESRRLTREQRVREREAKRILHEEELARLEAEGERAGSQDVPADDADADAKRASGRQRQTQREQHKKELEKLAAEDGTWYFDCSVCGQHGENMDDGSHSIACDRCNVWQHSKCHGYTPKQAEQDTFTFICGTCLRKEADAQKPKIPPLKLHNRSSASPETQKSGNCPAAANGQHMQLQLQHTSDQAGPHSTTGFHKPPAAPVEAQTQETGGYRYPPVSNFAPRSVQASPSNGQPTRPDCQPQPPMNNGYAQQAPSHHQQQHQYAHNSAISTAGGHPPQAQQQFSPQRQRSPNSQPWQHYQHPTENLQAQQRPGSSQLKIGFQSPSKPAVKPNLSPSQHNVSVPSYMPQPQWQHQQQHYQQPPQTQANSFAQQLQRSPDLAPPPNPRHQQSPVKSSPPQSAPRFALTPQNFPVSSAVADYQQQYASHMQTPQMREAHANGASPHATQVAADGMSGPWPSRSNDIPRKHDQAQSPAPPPSAQRVGDQKVLPPVTPLAPSPGLQSATTASSVPVKKMQLSPVMSSVEPVSIPPILSPMGPVIQPQSQSPPVLAPATVQAHAGAVQETNE